MSLVVSCLGPSIAPELYDLCRCFFNPHTLVTIPGTMVIESQDKDTANISKKQNRTFISTLKFCSSFSNTQHAYNHKISKPKTA